MSRVLLFVQTGDARPKVVTRYAANYSGLFSRNVEFARQNPDANTSKPLRSCANADRWWLVECENAETGRMIVGCCPLDDRRILASGVKEMR